MSKDRFRLTTVDLRGVPVSKTAPSEFKARELWQEACGTASARRAYIYAVLMVRPDGADDWRAAEVMARTHAD